MRDKINKPFIRGMLQIVLIIGAFHLYLILCVEKADQFNLNKAEEPVRQEIYKILDKCGSGYPVFWFVMQTDKMKDKFMIKGIFEKDYICKGSLEHCNKRYAGVFKLDSKTRTYLDSLESGQILFYEDSKLLPKYESIQSVLTLSARPINKVGIVLIKNYKDNLIYLFSLSNTTEGNKCSRENIINHLDKLGQAARLGI